MTYSADEATGGHHISRPSPVTAMPLEEAEQYGRSNAQEIWPVVKPVYEKMAEIVAHHIEGQGIADLWLAAAPVCSRAWTRCFASASGITGAFTAAQPVYDPAGDSQQRERKRRNLCKLNCRRRSFRHSIP